MRQRAFIHVEGPSGAGKTAFIEALLRSLDDLVICARAVRDGSIGRPEESAPKVHPELRRYRKAGASGLMLYRFPADQDGHFAFFETEFMQDYSNAVVIEGDCPVEYVDLPVFVVRPLPEGESLFSRVRSDHSPEYVSLISSLERAIGSPDDLVRFLVKDKGETIFRPALKSGKIIETIRVKLSETERWVLAPGYQGIERAKLVVVNVRDEDERRRGGRLIEDIARLRRDPAVFADVNVIRSQRIPITAVVADLADPKDAGLKKALARVKRAIRRAQE